MVKDLAGFFLCEFFCYKLNGSFFLNCEFIFKLENILKYPHISIHGTDR
jgi:hypothetical protein